MITIREAQDNDFDHIWPIFEEVARAGETYAFERDCNKEQAFSIWMDAPLKTFVVVETNAQTGEEQVIGTYYLKPNQAGSGNHVCNCGYMVSSKSRGGGLAEKMCKHSQTLALALGFKAMQFNFVVASNAGAVRLWQKLGFDIVGTLPKAFYHPALEYVDALVMYKWLQSGD